MSKAIRTLEEHSVKFEDKALDYAGSAESCALIAVVYELRALREQLRLAFEADRVEVRLDSEDVSLS